MDIFLALADPTRRYIIETLHQQGPQSIKALAESVPISRQALTKHLDRLVAAKLVNAEFSGKQRVHSLNEKPLVELSRWLAPYQQQWQARLQTLNDLIGEQHDPGRD